MKRKFLLALTLSTLTVGSICAQGEMDASKFSRNELRGTARSVSMGGAFGALGGDISGIAINPAGIGVYTKSEVVTTLNFQNVKTESDFNGITSRGSKFKPTFDNFALVGTFPLDSEDVPFLNFGFSYNRLKSFDRKYSAQGQSSYSSMLDFIGYRSGNIDPNFLDLEKKPNAWANTSWLPIFGYNSKLINRNNNTGYYYSAFDYEGDILLPYQNLSVTEKGSINSYDFNIGANISDIVSVGLTLAVTDIDYRMTSLFMEDYRNGYGSVATGGYDLGNSLKTEGTGIQVKVGTILKPIEELRIGISYHSPTWYNMTDFYSAYMDHNFDGMVGLPNNNLANNYQNGVIETLIDDYYRDAKTDYELRTPDKWTFSAAGVLDQKLILSADLELTNYKNAKLYDDNGNILDREFNPNNYIKEDFKMAKMLRVGAEYRITPQLSARAGYAWQESPLSKSFNDNQKEVMTVGSVANYTLDGDTNYITWGLGYRFTKAFYTDLAFVVASQKDKLYMFSKVDDADIRPDKIDLKTNKFQGMLTMGYRF